MTAAAIRRVPEKVKLHVASLTLSAWEGVLPRVPPLRPRAALSRLAERLLAALRYADAAFARLAEETNAYLAAGDAPPERQRTLERFLRELFFAEAAPCAPLARLPRLHHLLTDVVVSLAGMLVAALGFAVAVREPLVYGRAVLAPFAVAFFPFLALGLSALRSLALELSERRCRPRRSRAPRSARKKRLRSLPKGAPRARRTAA